MSIHTWEHFLQEIIDISKEHGFVYEIKYPEVKNYDDWKKYGLCEYADVGEEEFEGRIYTTIYYWTNKNEHSRDVISKCFLEQEGVVKIQGNMSLGYKFHKSQYTHKFKFHLSQNPILPKYPVYIISYQRYTDKPWKKGTCMTLEKMKVPYRLCVLTREVDLYNETLKRYKCQYCIEIIHIPDNNGLGGTPQRNKCWEHARELGFSFHWILDDNIDGYYWFLKREQSRIDSGVVFKNVEDVIENIIEPIALGGHSYYSKTPSTTMRVPFVMNGKNFSSILVNHSLLDKHNIKWRLKYNEDIDLGLQTLTNGLNTLSFELFLCNKKSTTENTEGGNKEIYDNYSNKGFQMKVDLLLETWKDIPKIVKFSNRKHKDNRPHHDIVWKHFEPPHPFTVKHTHTEWKNYGITYE